MITHPGCCSQPLESFHQGAQATQVVTDAALLDGVQTDAQARERLHGKILAIPMLTAGQPENQTLEMVRTIHSTCAVGLTRTPGTLVVSSPPNQSELFGPSRLL
jgi:hypothetical protein